LVVDNSVNAKLGDYVVLSLDEGSVLRASAVLYLIPTLSLIAGALAGWKMAARLGLGSDPASIAGALFGLALGLLLAKVFSAKMSRSTQYTPRIVAIAHRAVADPARQPGIS
jgi:sigma-E factor negative regulatory protein RseC